MLPSDYLNHGVLGIALFVLMLAVAVLFRVLLWTREILVIVLERIEHNTAALVRLSERLHGGEGDE